MTIVARKPLMLKEYLELDDDDSEYIASSGLAGARIATTIRCLLDAELRCGAASLVPRARPSKNALTKFSAAIQAVKLLPFSSDGRCPPSGSEGSPPRSFSDRLRGSFWGKKKKKKKKQNENERAVAEKQSAARLKDIIRIRSLDANGEGWRSLRFPSPAASSRSSWSETDSSGSDFLPASMASSESPHDIAASNSKHKLKKMADDEESEGEAVDSGPAKELFSKVMEESAECRSDEEEKEQLSPVSVIDYPYQQGHGDDDENNNDEEADSTSTSSPTFYRSFGNIERTKEQLLNRIRRFEMFAAHLDPIDLERCSRSTDAEDPVESTDHVASWDANEEGEVRARALLGELQPLPRGSMEKLLLDFFIQGQSRAGEAHRDRPMQWGHARMEATEMLNAARDWIDRKLDDNHGEATLREMQRDGRWRFFHEEDEDLAVHVEVSLLESLVEELVQDLTVLDALTD